MATPPTTQDRAQEGAAAGTRWGRSFSTPGSKSGVSIFGGGGVSTPNQLPAADPPVCAGRFCGGLVLDVKRKLPFFASDFYDALHIQALSTILFIYLGTVTNAITFGGLLGDATENMQVLKKKKKELISKSCKGGDNPASLSAVEVVVASADKPC